MRIERVDLVHVQVPLHEPFRISSGAVATKDALVVTVYADGLRGHGESSPMAGWFYNNETPETCWQALTRELIPAVLAASTMDVRVFDEIAARFPGNYFAKAGIETALWEIEATTANARLATLLGGDDRPVESGLAVGLQDTIPDLLDRIGRYLADGYRRVKIKIQPGWDVEPVAAVRREFGEVPLMVDANGAYDPVDLDLLVRLDEYHLLMIEQPFGPRDFAGHAALQAALRTPVCLDESVETIHDAERAISMQAARVINIKVQRMGGLQAAVRCHDVCQRTGMPVWVGTMPELGLGASHALALATLPNCTYPTDVEASDRFFVDDIITPPIAVERGLITAPPGVGTGYRLDEAKVARYAVARETFRRS